MAEMWRCPDCDRRFANRNQWHSCIELALADHLTGKSDHAVALYREFEAAVRAAGEFRIHPQKTRIAFITTMTFAGAKLARRWIDVSFILPEPVSDQRIRSIDMYGPTSFGHAVRLHEIEEIDSAVRSWLAAAYRRGRRETLDATAVPATVTGIARSRLMVPLRATVVEHDDGLAAKVPPYAAHALGDGSHVIGKVAGEERLGRVILTHDGARLVLDDPTALRQSGLGVGDPVDVFLRPQA